MSSGAPTPEAGAKAGGESFASTVVLRKPRLSLQDVQLEADDVEASVARTLRALDTEDLLGRLGSAEMVQELLRLLETLPLEEAAVPKLRCTIMYRRFDEGLFGSSEDLMRSLSGDKSLSIALLVEDVFGRYLCNDAADFLVSGNDPALSRRVAGSAALLLRAEGGGLATCGAASVGKALRAAYGFDFSKGVILARNKGGLGTTFTAVQR
mmetsp:Transcript_97989/g.316003  ORF Transcript_97989/g.316003 Transcript_97989/m.316003 type:complete len:210 (-) Transcript_97989:59-688(-)